jgi:signal transduction histidine kinase
MIEPQALTLAGEADRVAHQLAERTYPEVARALRGAIPAIITVWRDRSLRAIPELDRLTIDEFESSVVTMLDALAGAMECRDPKSVLSFIEGSPGHGVARFAQKFKPQTLLAEERILRTVVISQLRIALDRPLASDEAALLHALIDLMGEHSILAMISRGTDARDLVIQHQVSGIHRLADLGTLVAGLAHDATNLLLPLRMRLERLKRTDLPPQVTEDLVSIGLIVKQFQNLIVNLRWLSVDSDSPLSKGVYRPLVAVKLSEWAAETADFHRRLLPPNIGLRFDVPDDLPAVGISSAALSQAVFNLIHNAQQAIGPGPTVGRIVVRAALMTEGPGGVELTVEDDGPGMTPDVLRRATEPFFTTKSSGSGLGLALVQALLTGCGGTIEFRSPPPGKTRGTAAVLLLPVAALK